MSRKQIKRRAGVVTRCVIAGFFILIIACGVGFGVASADSSDDIARAGAFGFDETTHAATREIASSVNDSVSQNKSSDEESTLTTAVSRDLESGFQMIDEREEAERLRIQEENAKALQRVEENKRSQGVSSALDSSGAPVSSGATEYGLEAVDWSIGKDAFIAEWGSRINAYLAGSELDGYGEVFAQAAWDNGVDPRWSPAIANTESSKGQVCFLPYNAWGWGSRSWSDWTSAISGHVAGLAEGYGYSITSSAAATYCPPNQEHWYSSTLQEMSTI